MAVHGKAYGEKPPTAFPKTLEIETTDFHIPSAPAATVNLIQNQNPKGPSPVRLPFASFRLILQLEKTPRLRVRRRRFPVYWTWRRMDSHRPKMSS